MMLTIPMRVSATRVVKNEDGTTAQECIALLTGQGDVNHVAVNIFINDKKSFGHFTNDKTITVTFSDEV